LILEDDAEPRRLLGDRALPASFATAPWGRLPEDELKDGHVRAALYQVDGRGRCPADGLRRLRRLAGAIPLLPFRLEGNGAGARRPGRRTAAQRRGVVALAPPLALGLLEALLERERRVAALRRRVRRILVDARDQRAMLRTLVALVRETGNELDPHRVIDRAMERVHAFLRPRAWIFLLADPARGVLTVERTGGEGATGMLGKQIAIGEGIAGRAVRRKRPLLVVAARAAGALSFPELPPRLAARSVLAVPLLSRGRVIGVVEAVDRACAGRLSPGDARLLSLLLEPVAVALDNALLLRRSEELSITDDLTKLYNSRYLNATLRREVERSKRYRSPVSLIFLDLDGFKNVNDQHGHLWGSRTLIEVGEVIGKTVREIDVVSRFGGDEFTVILPQTGPEGALIIADRIRQRIEETTFLEAHGLNVRITASLGIASFPDHGRTKDDLIARADQAMYLVKGRGKNGVGLADPAGPCPLAAQSAR
jgi:diguanylate cyclase (GGDEF)-like protein